MTTSEGHSTPPVPPCRLFAILAREVPRAVILRRGPSKWVQMILWHTDDDTFEYGQWFHGRIYEYSCDLSPDGVLFVYFAAKFNAHTLQDHEYTHAWTAISKPPYLTALALWPQGDIWDGGGMFLNRRTLRLNHTPERSVPHPAHQPRGLKIELPSSGQQRDDAPIPFYTARLAHLEHAGWNLVQKGVWPPLPRKQRRWEAQTPAIWQKAHPSGRYWLYWVLDAYNLDRLDSMEIAQYVVQEQGNGKRVPIADTSWADWDQQGRLVYARDGKLWATAVDEPTGAAQVLTDLTHQRPYALTAPAWAQRW